MVCNTVVSTRHKEAILESLLSNEICIKSDLFCSEASLPIIPYAEIVHSYFVCPDETSGGNGVSDKSDLVFAQMTGEMHVDLLLYCSIYDKKCD